MEGVEGAALKKTLEQKYGPIVGEIDIHYHKACAFFEFETIEAAKNAIKDSLSPNRGGLGGVTVTVDNKEFKVFVEPKRLIISGRSRGGGHGQVVNGDGRGGYHRGRGTRGQRVRT